jgi:hypothetical protein
VVSKLQKRIENVFAALTPQQRVGLLTTAALAGGEADPMIRATTPVEQIATIKALLSRVNDLNSDRFAAMIQALYNQSKSLIQTAYLAQGLIICDTTLALLGDYIRSNYKQPILLSEYNALVSITCMKPNESWKLYCMM